MSTLFLDTGYVVALEASDDQHHEEAQAHWQQLARPALPKLVTTSFVFDEVVTFFNSRDLHGKVVEVGRRLRESRSVELVHIGEGLLEAGWRLLRERPDKRYSLTDCISFVVMRRRALREALAFDHHFEQAGFTVQPGLP